MHKSEELENGKIRSSEKPEWTYASISHPSVSHPSFLGSYKQKKMHTATCSFPRAFLGMPIK